MYIYIYTYIYIYIYIYIYKYINIHMYRIYCVLSPKLSWLIFYTPRLNCLILLNGFYCIWILNMILYDFEWKLLFVRELSINVL